VGVFVVWQPPAAAGTSGADSVIFRKGGFLPSWLSFSRGQHTLPAREATTA
jgi:hypothetical protein